MAGWHHAAGEDREREGERPTAARDQRARAAWRIHAVCLAEQGRGKGADRWAAATVPDGGTCGQVGPGGIVPGPTNSNKSEINSNVPKIDLIQMGSSSAPKF
jgi:hypothetical protein